jgi:pyruvate dehydrogenase E2 component (dihydrolipoamide acetyltransferase)
MATPVIMPRQGNTVETCIISAWHKKKGEKVDPGDVLFTYETDKASFDEESPVKGTLLEIFFDVDDEVPVLTNVCVIGEEGEAIDEFKSSSQDTLTEQKESKPAPVLDKKEIEPDVEGSDDKLRISPRARKLAEKEMVDPAMAKGSGPYGRIIEKDIMDLAISGQKATYAAKDEMITSKKAVTGTGIGGRVTSKDLLAPELDYEDVKLSNIRKVIAKAMHTSLSNTAQLTLNTSFDATQILDLRKKLKDAASKEDLVNITLNDIVLYAVVKTLKKHKDLNAHFLDDKTRYFKNVHMGIAVDTDRGLLVPTLFGADTMTLSALAAASKTLISEAKSGKISPDSLTGGTFTVTNLGVLGIESFTPVINPPQTGILGVNNITYKQKKTENGFVTYPAMGLSLTFDHRAIDGAPAARFLQDLVSILENIVLMLI